MKEFNTFSTKSNYEQIIIIHLGGIFHSHCFPSKTLYDTIGISYLEYPTCTIIESTTIQYFMNCDQGQRPQT